MTPPRLLAVLVTLFALAPAVAGADIVVDGRPFASWSAFFTSDYFRDNGKRCGTVVRGLQGKGARTLDASGDCALNFTNPSEEYEPGAIYEIPVVVHRFESILGDGVFPDSLVRTQIDVLNEDFLAIQGTPGAPGKDTRIRFRLVTEDPEGNPHPGFTRTVNDFWFNDLPDPVNGTYYDAMGWDPNRYLNIYTLSPQAPGGLILGYTYLPQDGVVGDPLDGVRVLWNAFGRPAGNAPYHLGRTATHEVGHWAGLWHPFDNSNACSTAAAPDCYVEGDAVCDTPPDDASHGGCDPADVSCAVPAPIHNYMEYTDDACMWEFTPEQARRMVCTLRHWRPNVYRASTVAVSPVAARAGVSLAPNVPNPFVGSTTLAFELAQAGDVSVEIMDVAGRRVRVLAAGAMPVGRHALAWDGRDDAGRAATPGVYFYRVADAAGEAAVRRMVLVR
jgi:hypothetical protein